MNSFKAARRIASLRKQVVDYFKNPHKHIDLSDIEHYDDDRFIVRMTPLDQIMGLEHLGSGCYADVYALDDQRVLKVIKKEDSGYQRYVDLIRKHPNNPHFPKVFYQGKWGQKQVYILERLSAEPVTEETKRQEAEDAAWQERYDAACHDERRRMRRERDNNYRVNLDRNLNSYFRNAIRSQSDNPYMGFATPEIAEVARLFKEHNIGNDLHAGNLMFRGETPVVTDPCTY